MDSIEESVSALQDQVKTAFAQKSPLQIVGGNSKFFYGYASEAESTLSSATLNGVISYEPGELMLQVSAGTKLSVVIEMLAKENQILACEPPVFNGEATIGGMVATGISGSRRPYAGAVRDFVLGLNIIDGKGQLLSFGGQVMKNVAGYDVSRLMVGALGCLGFMTEVSFKVLPKPELELTKCREISQQDAQALMPILKQKYPLVSASAFYQGQLYLRFSGMAASVEKSAAKFGGGQCENSFWADIDNLNLFDRSKDLWRLSVPPSSDLFFAESELLDWGAGQRWLQNSPREVLSRKPEQGHATRIWGESELSDDSIFQPLDPVLLNLHKGLKREFDPAGILNPQKMYRQI